MASNQEVSAPSYQLNQAEIAADAARDTLTELRAVRDELMAQVVPQSGVTDPQKRIEYWLGLLEGTIFSLLATMTCSQPHADSHNWSDS